MHATIHHTNGHHPHKPNGKRAAARLPKPTSQRKIEANRANTRILPGECEATYEIFLNELHEELQPRSIMQKHLLPQIARQLWKLQRIPGAEVHLMQSLASEAGDEVETWPELLARCFQTGDSSPLLRLERYERGIQSTLLRLMNRYYWMKKHHPTTPPDPDEQFCELIERDREARRRDEERSQAIREQREREQLKRRQAYEKGRQRARQRQAQAEAQQQPRGTAIRFAAPGGRQAVQTACELQQSSPRDTTPQGLKAPATGGNPAPPAQNEPNPSDVARAAGPCSTAQRAVPPTQPDSPHPTPDETNPSPPPKA